MSNNNALMKFKEATDGLQPEQFDIAFQMLASRANQNQYMDIFDRPAGTKTRFNCGQNMIVSIDFTEGAQSVTIEGNRKTPAAMPTGSNTLKVVAV